MTTKTDSKMKVNTSEASIDAQAASGVSITQKQNAKVEGKHRNWSITLNNPTEEELAVWKAASSHHWVEKALGQLERGESGTIHLQAMLKTKPVRFAQVKKLLPRAHIEVAHHELALERYVKKEDTRVASLPDQTNMIQTATPRAIQDRLTSVVYERIYDKGLPLVWRRHEVELTGGVCVSRWKCTYLEDEEDDLEVPYPFEACIRKNRKYVESHADQIIDEAIACMIADGVYGAEYVTANVACRAALKRFIVEICIRNENQRLQEAFQRTQAFYQAGNEAETVPEDIDP